MKVSQEELFGAMATLTGVTGNTAGGIYTVKSNNSRYATTYNRNGRKDKKLGYENGQAYD